MTLPFTPRTLPQWAVDRRLAIARWFRFPVPDMVGRDGRGTWSDMRAVAVVVLDTAVPPDGRERLKQSELVALLGRTTQNFHRESWDRVGASLELARAGLLCIRENGWRLRPEVLAAQTVTTAEAAAAKAEWAGVFAKECGA